MRLLLLSLAVTAVLAQSVPPEQIHIALAGQDEAGVSNAMAVSWATATATATSTVLYGLSPNALTFLAAGDGVTYLQPYQHHHVILTGLKQATRYYYKVGDATAGFSGVLSFVTAPGNGQPFNVAVYGDLGYGVNGNALETRAQLDRVFADYDLTLHAGDVSYADDAYLHTPLSFEYENVYNNYMNWMQNVTATKPYMVLPGNHEGECHSPACIAVESLHTALGHFSAFNARFRMPAPESDATGLNMWYSFNYGMAHFINIDTETDYVGAPEETMCPIFPCGGFAGTNVQLEWLEADLAAAASQRSLRPWIIVSGHRPIYTPEQANPDGSPSGYCQVLQTFIETLMMKYGVDIYFSGHVHAYQRSYSVYNNVVDPTYNNPKYPVHFIVGGAGCDEMGGRTATHNANVAAAGNPAWLAAADGTHYGMGILKFVNASVVEWQWFESKDGSVLDSVVITKNH